MKFVSYWETAPGRMMPPYVALSIAAMQQALGDSFELLTPESAPDYIGGAYLEKNWTFHTLEFDFSPDIASIVAKSDFIRMAYVYHQGGCWIDADTIVLENLLSTLGAEHLDSNLLWYSEAFFGAAKGNEILDNAMRRSLQDDIQMWGDPGGIRTLINESPSKIKKIPSKYFDPGYRPSYNFSTCQVLMDTNLSAEEFLLSEEMKMMKLYNTYFSRSMLNSSLANFFDSDTLLAKIFLKINSDPEYWICQGAEIMQRAGGLNGPSVS